MSIRCPVRAASFLKTSLPAPPARRGRNRSDGGVAAFHHELRFEIARELATILLQVAPDTSIELARLLIAAVIAAPDEVADFVQSMVLAQDGREERDRFQGLPLSS